MSTSQNNQSAYSWLASAILILLASLCPPAIYAQTVSSDYAKAKGYYDRGDLRGAGRLLQKILKRYPDHQPSNILIGRVYYGLGQPTKAARAFGRVAADSIPNDTAFEYGASMFAANQCSNAVQGFARVPESTGLKGIADFYTGVCFMKKKLWHKAGIFLRRAKKLPPSLASSRRKLLRTLDDREKEERQGQIGQPYQMLPSLPPPPVYVPYSPSLPPGPGGAAPPDLAKAEPKKEPKKAPPPKTGFSFSATPALTYIGIQKSDEHHGFKTTETNGNSKEATLGLLLRYDGAPRDFGGQPAFTLPVNFGRYSSVLKTKSTKFSAFEDAPDTVFTEVTEAEGASITTSADGGASSRTYATGETWEYSVLPTGTIPVTESFDLEVKYLSKEVYPHMHSDLKSGSRGPSGKIVAELGATTFTATVGSTDSLNAKGDITRNDLSLGAELARSWDTLSGKLSYGHTDSSIPGDFPKSGAKASDAFGATMTKNFDSLALTGGIKQTNLTPWPEIALAGAAANMRADLTAKMSFEWFSVSGTGSMTQLTDYQVLGLEHPTEVDADGKAVKTNVLADGTTTAAVAVLKVTPFDWLWGAVVYSTTSSEYSVKNPDLAAKFKASVVNQSTQFTYAAGVSKSF